MDLKDTIRSINDFPEEGIIFRDITTLLKNPAALKQAVDQIEEQLKDVDYDIIVAPESRGFIFGMPLAYNTGKGFVPIRKKGKLPAETISKEYALEYGTATIEMHVDALEKEIVRICTEKPYSKEACTKKAKEFDKNERFKEYVELYERINTPGT